MKIKISTLGHSNMIKDALKIERGKITNNIFITFIPFKDTQLTNTIT